MRRLRTTSTQRLVAIAAALVALALTGALAQAAISGSDPKPDPKPLDRAVHDAITAPPVDGVSARVTFTNGLLPSGSLPQDAASPIAADAEGRLSGGTTNSPPWRTSAAASTGWRRAWAGSVDFWRLFATSRGRRRAGMPARRRRPSRDDRAAPLAGAARVAARLIRSRPVPSPARCPRVSSA